MAKAKRRSRKKAHRKSSSKAKIGAAIKLLQSAKKSCG